jgi:membrane fusion protein, multidrug efflux system
MVDYRPQKSHRLKAGTVVYFAVAVSMLLAAIAAYVGLAGKREVNLQTEAEAREIALRAGPRVQCIVAARGPTEKRIELVGEAKPYAQVTLYAKVSGYLREIKVDIGDRVTRDQVLALIESPELDRQYEAALADAKNKAVEANRYADLLPKKAVSTESAEDRATAARVAQKNLAALEAQRDYKIIRAPFAGTITARFVDTGALIQNAGNSVAAATPVVAVSQLDRLKVYAYADQNTAGSIHVGDRAYIGDSARPETKVSAALSRTSVQLNGRTRTLLLEFDVDNRQGGFIPGSFVQVILVAHAPARVQIPVGALTFHGTQPFAAVLGQDNRVDLRPVVIAESDGKMVKLESGVEEGEKVALSAGADLADGDIVQPIDPGSK